MEDDDWIFLGDGGGSDTDSASDTGSSDSDSGFTMIVRRGRKGGDADAGFSSAVVSDDAPAPQPPRVPAVAVPHPTPPGLSFKLVSYAEAFSAGGGREPQQPGCNDDDSATTGEAIVQGAGIDDAAGTASTDDCCTGCESDSDQGGEHDGTGSSVQAPSVAAPTVNRPESTAVLHGEAHSDYELSSAEEVEKDDDSEGCEEDADDDDMENSSENNDDTDGSSEEDTDSSSDEVDTDSSSEDEDTDSSSDDEDEDAFSSGDEEYTEIFSEEEYTGEVYSEEEHEDEDDDASGCSGEEEEDDGSENSGEQVGDYYVESSGEEEDDDDDAECSGDVDDAESNGEEEDAESTGEEEEGDPDPEISGEDKEGSNAECSGEEDDVESSGKEEESSGSDMDTDTSGSGSDMEDDDCFKSDEEDYTVDVAENGNQDIFAMLLPKDKASGTNMEDYSFDMKKYDIADVAQNGNQDIFAMLLPKNKASGPNMEEEDYSFDMEDDIAHVAQNGNQRKFILPCRLCALKHACGGGVNISDYEEEEDDGSLFDMLLTRDRAIDDDTDTDSSDMEHNHLESDEEGGIVNVAENVNQEIFDRLLLTRALACYANIDDGDIDSSDEEDESATATAASGYSAEASHGTRRPEFAGRAARGYDDIDTDTDMEEGDDDEVVVAAHVDGTRTSPYGLPRATTGGGGVEIQRWGFACQSQAERQALWEDLRRVLEDLQRQRRQLAAEADASSGQPQQQQRSYDDVDDTCDVPGTAAPGGGPALAGSCTCARTAEAQFTARAVRDTERELAMEEARRREAAQLELDRALARQAAAAAEALELALEDCERQATVDVVTLPAVAKRHVQADITFIIGVYVLVFLVVSLLSLALPSSN